jgi:hypothetical protein
MFSDQLCAQSGAHHCPSSHLRLDCVTNNAKLLERTSQLQHSKEKRVKNKGRWPIIQMPRSWASHISLSAKEFSERSKQGPLLI